MTGYLFSMDSFQYFLKPLVLLLIVFNTTSVCSKLLFVKIHSLEEGSYLKMHNCLSASIYRFYEGRTLLFLGDEIRDSFGEQLLIKGINATVDINNKPLKTHEYKQLFILQPQPMHQLKSYDHILSKVEKASYFLILWPFKTSMDKVSKLHDKLWKFRILRVASFIPTSLGNFDIYSYFPYTNGSCGTGTIVEKIDRCNSTGFQNNFNLFSGLVKLQNFHGCNIKCIGNNQYPESVMNQQPNGTWEVGGNIVYVLNTFKAHYNVSLTYLNVFNDTYGWFYYNTSVQTLMRKYANKSYEFAFGAFTILNAMNNPELDYSFASNPECISWAVPLFAGKSPSLWNIYVNEFPLLVWCFIGLAVFTATKFVLVARQIEKKNFSFVQVIRFALTMMFSMISDSPRLKSNLVSVNMFLFQWSIWGLIVRCAYEASLGSMMTVEINALDIKSYKELYDNDFQVAGGVKMYELLKRSANGKYLKSLVKKFEILPPNDGKKVLNDMFDHRNLAVLQPNRYTVFLSGTYAKLRGMNSLAFVMRPCLLKTYNAPLLIRRGSIMSELLYVFISRVFEAGLIKYWKMKETMPREKPPSVRRSLTLHKLHGAFVIYSIGIGLAAVVLFAEMVQTKIFNPSKRSSKKKISSKHDQRLPFVM